VVTPDHVAALAAALLRLLPPRAQAGLIERTYARLGHVEIGEYFADRVRRADRLGLLDARLAVNRFHILDELATMRVPTLVLVGDAFGKMAITMARTTARNVPGAIFEVLPGGGDPSNLMVPDAFDGALLSFLGSVTRNQ
jgi:pimeloyl-ACP methyl ester carboxylesterase